MGWPRNSLVAVKAYRKEFERFMGMERDPSMPSAQDDQSKIVMDVVIFAEVQSVRWVVLEGAKICSMVWSSRGSRDWGKSQE